MGICPKPQPRTLSLVPFCEVNIPRFFAGWPYYILLVAALMMGSSKVSSEARQDTAYASVVGDPTLRTLGCSIATDKWDKWPFPFGG